jgi:hypothetical protein
VQVLLKHLRDVDIGPAKEAGNWLGLEARFPLRRGIPGRLRVLRLNDGQRQYQSPSKTRVCRGMSTSTFWETKDIRLPYEFPQDRKYHIIT